MSLQKEMYIAILLGLVLGGAVAVFIAQIPQKLLPSITEQTVSPTISNIPTPTLALKRGITLEIAYPENQAFVDDENIVVSGKTTPHAMVAVTSDTDEMIQQADEKGTFSIPITLIEGANELFIVSFNNNESTEQTIVVNFTKENI